MMIPSGQQQQQTQHVVCHHENDWLQKGRRKPPTPHSQYRMIIFISRKLVGSGATKAVMHTTTLALLCDCVVEVRCKIYALRVHWKCPVACFNFRLLVELEEGKSSFCVAIFYLVWGEAEGKLISTGWKEIVMLANLCFFQMWKVVLSTLLW